MLYQSQDALVSSRNAEYAPPYHYGGLLSDKPLTPTVSQGLARRLSKEWLLHTIIVSASPRGGIVGWENYQTAMFTSHALDLSGVYGAVWQRAFDDKQHNSIRKARRSGASVRKNKPVQAVASFYRLYSIASGRWKNPHLEPEVFFARLLSTDEPSVSLWLAAKHGLDIAGIIVANNAKDTADYVAGASDANYWKYCPNNLLLSFAIEDACVRGFTEFDFLPSGGICSVERFKESFGAARVQVPEYWLRGRLPSLKSRLMAGCRLMR
ncbi:MAG: GNAT family N-acetyltransferase [Chloroflexi bacterium]|nr:GNAT family N-acetyltransferase [Chloroflexota bacterium]